MGLAHTYSAVLVGVQAHIIQVQADVGPGLPGLALVGLPDSALNEARDRVRAAVVNSGLKWPDQKVTVSLSPAWLPKRGSGLDVAIAIAILAAHRQLPASEVSRVLALGELGLDGSIRPAAGALATALALRRSANRSPDTIAAGPTDGRTLRAVPGLAVIDVPTLAALVARLTGEQEPDPVGDGEMPSLPAALAAVDEVSGRDMSEVRGQFEAKRALEIAAAGGHHVALLGRAGVGKTLLAERFPTLLPDLDDERALEVTAIHQLTGRGGNTAGGLVRRPPWFAPHHTASRAAMVGGGSDSKPSIGLVSSAHHGVLFLDEAAEFEPGVLDALREPLESGAVSIARAGFHLSLPAQFQLVIATNPCPCGNALDTHTGAQCRCTPAQRRKYLARLSGPLLDRVDVRVVLRRPSIASLRDDTTSEESAVIAARVARVRDDVRERLAGTPWSSIVEVPAKELMQRWALDSSAASTLELACRKDSLRGRDRVVRVAWTIAALADRPSPNAGDVEEAVALRASEDQWVA
ncbi:MAG: YifB family Mg chelatase-like AAA ATPase [Candidatus Nanopelagicales bacterium]